jgi:hypothetical protein
MNPLEQRVQFLESVINALLKSDRYLFEKTIQLADGRNVQLGRTTGTKVGLSALEKLGFFGATPVVQHGTTGESGGFTGGFGSTMTSTSTSTGGLGGNAYTFGDVVRALKKLGAMQS